MGAMSGAVQGYQDAKAMDRNPWTGKSTAPVLEPAPLPPLEGTLGTGFGPEVPPIRMQGPWTTGDLARAVEGKGPIDFIPTVNKAGNPMPLELHHADQMPGSSIHEVLPAHSKFIPHLNKFNQGVTPLMRMKDSQIHWYFRGLEMGNK